MSNWQSEYPHPPPAGPIVKCNHVICTRRPTLYHSFACCTDRHGHTINLQLLERKFIIESNVPQININNVGLGILLS